MRTNKFNMAVAALLMVTASAPSIAASGASMRANQTQVVRAQADTAGADRELFRRRPPLGTTLALALAAVAVTIGVIIVVRKKDSPVSPG